MKHLLIIMLAIASSAVYAETVSVQRTPLGSGVPGQVGVEQAVPVMDGMYHAPQYMPGHPTSATLYPRVIDVNCTKVATGLSCDGYNWLPELGRGEYLLIRPRLAQPPPTEKPVVIFK